MCNLIFSYRLAALAKDMGTMICQFTLGFATTFLRFFVDGLEKWMVTIDMVEARKQDRVVRLNARISQSALEPDSMDGFRATGQESVPSPKVSLFE